MVAVDDGAVKVDFDGARAHLVVNDLEVYDDHDLANSLTLGLGLPGLLGSPLIPGVAPVRATVSFDIEWNGVVASAMIHNVAQQFEGMFLSTGATIKWSAEQPGFQFDSEPPNPSRNLISVLGHEKNGVFFT